MSTQSENSAAFLRAARSGEEDTVLQALNNGMPINTCNSNGLNALHLAAKEGHTGIVKTLLLRGADIEAETKKGNTALHISSLAGQYETTTMLLERGAEVNASSRSGFTPLYMASQENHIDVVRLLLEHGANQRKATEDGFTPLAVALQQGHEEVVGILREHDTKDGFSLLHDISRRNDAKSAMFLLQKENIEIEGMAKHKFTPLHVACHYGSVDVAKVLIEYGARVNLYASNNITPLHVSANKGFVELVQLLLYHQADQESSTKDGLIPLHTASRYGKDDVVGELLHDRNDLVEYKSKSGLTPLHMATQDNHVRVIKLLLAFNAYVDTLTNDNITALHIAAHYGHVDAARYLLDNTAEANAKSLNGFTPLHVACKKNRYEVVELLLDRGSSIQAQTQAGLSPLHVATFFSNYEIVELLVRKGASIDTVDRKGETALHVAGRIRHEDIAQYLLKMGANADAKARQGITPLHIISYLGHGEMVQTMIDYGAQADAMTKSCQTPLQIACKEGHIHVVDVLLQNGASLSLTTKVGYTPLHTATKYGRTKIVSLLLKKFASPDAEGKNGITPLHVAAHYDRVEIALLLLGHGASPYLRVKNGFTPLHIACKRGHLKIVKILLEHKALPNEQTRNGIAPIHLAAQYGYDNIVKVLIEYDADTGIAAKNGMTPLHLAAQEDFVNMAARLLDYGAPINAVTLAGYTSLHVACYYGNIATAILLICRGAGINDQTKDGLAPLHMAAQQGHANIVDALAREYNADCQCRTASGLTALQLAYFANQEECIKILQQYTAEEYINDEQMAQMRSAAVMEMNLRPEVLKIDDEDNASDNVSVYYPEEDNDWRDLHRTNLEKYYTSLSERYVSMRQKRDKNELMHAREFVRPDGSIMYITETTIKPSHGDYRTVRLEDGTIVYLIETLYLPMDFVSGETREVKNPDGSITLVTEMDQPPANGEYKVLTRADGSVVYIVETTYMPPEDGYDAVYTREVLNADGSVTYITESTVPPPEGEYRTETKPDGTVVYITEVTYLPEDQVSGEAVTREVRHSDGSLTLITETTFKPPEGNYRKSKRPDGTIIYIIEVNYVPVNDLGDEVVREVQLPGAQTALYLETYYQPQNPHETIELDDGSVIYRQQLDERLPEPRIIAVTRDDNSVYYIRETTYIPGDDKYRPMRRDDGVIVFLDENLPSTNQAAPSKQMAPVRRADGSVVYISKFTYLPPSGPFKAMKRSDGTVEYYGEQSYMPAPVKKVTRADGTVAYITESTYMPAVGKFRAMRREDGTIVYITEQQYRPQAATEDRITEVKREDGTTVYITETTKMPTSGPYKMMKKADGTIVYIIESTSMPSSRPTASQPSIKPIREEPQLGAIAEEPTDYPHGTKISKKPSFGKRLKKTFSFRKKGRKDQSPPRVPPRPNDDMPPPPIPPLPVDTINETEFHQEFPEESFAPPIPPPPPPPEEDEEIITTDAAGLRRTPLQINEEYATNTPNSPEKQDFSARRSMFENKIRESVAEPGQAGKAYIVPTPENSKIWRRQDTPALKPASRITTYNTVTTNVVYDYRLVDDAEDMEEAAANAAMIAAEKAKAEAAQKSSTHKSSQNLPAPEGIDVEFDEVSNPSQGSVIGPQGGTLISSRFGIRIIVPPNALHSDIKIECRLLEKKSNSGRTVQPSLKDAEALANRVLEISPAGTYFSKPISIEIPYYIAVEGYSREICVMSSEKGDGWSDHKLYRVLPFDENSDDDEYYVAISSQSLPSYYAVVSRIIQEITDVGNDGGEIFSSYVPYVRVDVPAESFHKESDTYIRVLPVYQDDLSTTGISGATPVLTLEPRIRLKQPVTITLPDLTLHPKADPNSPIRLLRSITPYDKQPQWEDITDSTDITDEGNGILSFDTNQFARYWIVQVRQALTAKDKGSSLYRKMTAIPYLANVAVFANSYQPGEASMRIVCMTNDGLFDSLDYQEGMVLVASKENVAIIDGSRISIQCSGNLLPIKAKSTAWQMDFKPYRENILDSNVRVTTPSDPPKGLMSFVRDSKIDGRTISQVLCTVGVVLPQGEGPEGNVTISHEYRVFAETMDVAIEEIAEHGIDNSESNDDQSNVASVAAAIGNDWAQLARELQLKESDIKAIDAECSPNSTASAQNILHTWAVRSGRDATGVKLESALVGIGREDVIEHFESEVASGVTYEKTQLPGGQIVIKKKISRRLPPEEIDRLKRNKDVVVTPEGHIVQTKQTVITGNSGNRDQMLAKLRQQMDQDEEELRNSAAGEIVSEEIEFQHDDADRELVDEIRTDVERRKYEGYGHQRSAKGGYGAS